MPRVILLAALAIAAPDRAWMFVIDGLRDSEGIAAGTENLPWLVGTMATRGTLVTGLQNRDSTQTDGAHRGALSGRRQPHGGLPWYDGRQLERALTPTVFEVIGRDRDLSLDGGYVDGNTVFMDSQGRSLYPGMARFGAREFPTEEDSTLNDVAMVELAVRRIADFDPTVILLNLHEADKNGHSARWDGYVASVANEDDLVRELAGSVIGDNDLVFVFADHGRHLDDRWPGHTDTCSGCRTSFLLAWGPGVAEGVVVDGGWELEDIAPTVAWLMGAELPHARGRPIAPLLASAPSAPADSASLVDPELVTGPDGTIHRFAVRLRDATSGAGILHDSSDDGGRNWTAGPDLPLGAGITPEELRAVATETGLRVAWRAYDEALGTWTIVSTEGSDAGWATPTVADADVFQTTLASLVDGPDGGVHGWWWSEVIGIADAPADFVHVVDGVSTLVTGPGTFHLPAEVELLSTGDDIVGSFAAIPAEDYFYANDNRDIWVLNEGATHTPQFVRVSDDDDFSYWPDLAQGADGTLHLAWSSRQGANPGEGGWRLAYATSTDGGDTWTAPAYFATDSEAWRPTLLTHADGVSVAWVEVSAGVHRLQVAQVEGGQLGSVTTVAQDEWVIDRLAAVPVDGGFLLGWGQGRATLDHRLATARIAPTGAPLDAVPPDPEPPCGCEGGSGVLAVGVVAAWRRRVRR